MKFGYDMNYMSIFNFYLKNTVDTATNAVYKEKVIAIIFQCIKKSVWFGKYKIEFSCMSAPNTYRIFGSVTMVLVF